MKKESLKLRVEEIADRIEGRVLGDGDAEIKGVSTIEAARNGDITFLGMSKYFKHLESTKASAVIVPNNFSESTDKTLILVDNPYFAFMQTVVLFHPPEPLLDRGIHETAVIGEDTELGEGIAVGAYAVIGKRCRIGAGTVIMPGVVIGDEVIVGESCVLHARVCLREKVTLGDRVVLHCGAVIGSDGFSFASEEGTYHKIPQVGTVVIEDDVEIGALTAVDRSTLGETRIKRGVKLDNLIQVGHNCIVGEDTVIAAQVGLAGSTRIGKGVRVGGHAGFAGHMDIGDGAVFGAKSLATKSLPGGEYYLGFPAKPHMDESRIQGAMRRLPQLLKEMKELKERIQRLEEGRD